MKDATGVHSALTHRQIIHQAAGGIGPWLHRGIAAVQGNQIATRHVIVVYGELAADIDSVVLNVQGVVALVVPKAGVPGADLAAVQIKRCQPLSTMRCAFVIQRVKGSGQIQPILKDRQVIYTVIRSELPILDLAGVQVIDDQVV